VVSTSGLLSSTTLKEEIDQLKESTAQKEKLIRQMIQGTSA
jgi:hypothetical protein